MIGRQLDIFGKNILMTPKTEGIKYAGSKLKILPHIVGILNNLEVRRVCDGFSGSTRVSQAFAQLGYDTTSSDISVWSEVFATCYLRAHQSDQFYQKIIDHLNGLSAYDGWYTQHYGAKLAETKRPFQAKNTRKLDAIRDEIENLNLAWEDKCVILTSLIYALDSVDSTLGHYEMVSKPFILLHAQDFGSAFVRPRRRTLAKYAFLVHPRLAQNPARSLRNRVLKPSLCVLFIRMVASFIQRYDDEIACAV